MARSVIVLDDGSHGPPQGWPGTGELDPAALGRGDAAAWAKLQEAVRSASCVLPNGYVRSAISEGAGSSLNVFVCLTDDEVLGTNGRAPDSSSIGQLLGQARLSSCGARLFLVVREELKLPKSSDDRFKESREQWIRTAHAKDVMDLLQVEYNLVERSIQEGLRDAAAESKTRYAAILNHLPLEGGWHCWVDPEEKNLCGFLSTWMLYHRLEEPSNLVIVLNGVPGKQQEDVEKGLSKFPRKEGWRHLVVALRAAAPGLTQDWCRENGLLGLIKLQGELQLWYLLLCLNEWRRE